MDNNRRFRRWLRWGLLLLLLLASCVAPTMAPLEELASSEVIRANYQDIPAGFDFPADEATLLRFRDTENVAEMRRHSWYVWAGLTQPAAGGEAIWETWYSVREAFVIPAMSETPTVEEELQRDFIAPRQSIDLSGPTPEAIGASLLSFVLFNEAAKHHIFTNKFYLGDTLTALNEEMNTAGTPPEERRIKDFPAEAMSLKTTWWAIRGDGLTPLPVWDFNPANTRSTGGDWTKVRCANGDPNCRNDYDTWPRIVAVDASRDVIPVGETVDMSFNGIPHESVRVVPLSSLYHFKLETDEQVAAVSFSTDVDLALGRAPQIGDYVALVAFHYTTKEIADWVWSTFWWHDSPDNGPYAMDRPAAVTGVWRNYLMDTSYSMVTPREFDGTPNAVYNPWLEARFANGVSSNCMTCHQRSVWGDPTLHFLPVTTGGLAPNDPHFADTLQLDFMWSLLIEPQ